MTDFSTFPVFERVERARRQCARVPRIGARQGRRAAQRRAVDAEHCCRIGAGAARRVGFRGDGCRRHCARAARRAGRGHQRRRPEARSRRGGTASRARGAGRGRAGVGFGRGLERARGASRARSFGRRGLAEPRRRHDRPQDHARHLSRQHRRRRAGSRCGWRDLRHRRARRRTPEPGYPRIHDRRASCRCCSSPARSNAAGSAFRSIRWRCPKRFGTSNRSAWV